MLKLLKGKVTLVKQIAKETLEMTFQNEYIAKTALPGQFLHILVKKTMLRRPISIANVNEEESTVTIIFKIVGSGTKRLANYQVNETINILGPSGAGFPMENLCNKKVLLIGGGVGIPPLYFLGKKLAEDPSISILTILGFQSKEYRFYVEQFESLGETTVTTDDGTFGKKGFVTNALDDLSDIDRYYTCGPTPMLRSVTERLKHIEGYISLEEYMGCGVGACFACVVPTSDGKSYRKICQDGPVFIANEVKI